MFPWKNNDLNDLKTKLEDLPKESKKLIVVDGIYSMKGSIAPIKELNEIAESTNSYIFIDDAHGFGTVGPRGLGILDLLNIKNNDRLIYLGSFSKSASNPVGFVSCSKILADYLDASAGFLIYSGPPSNLHVATSLRHLINFDTQKYKGLRYKIYSLSKWAHKECLNHNIKVLSTCGFYDLAQHPHTKKRASISLVYGTSKLRKTEVTYGLQKADPRGEIPDICSS